MSESDRLAEQAQSFASRLNDLLARTVGAEPLIGVREDPKPLSVLIAVGADRGLRFGTVPVRVGESGLAYLLVSYKAALDIEERRYLTVMGSTFGLYLLTDAHKGLLEPVFRYDFDRGKRRFAPAHIQVHGQSGALGRLFALAGRTDAAELQKLHLPVGGSRFRPSLEDVLECLFQEQLLRPLPSWQVAIEEHRGQYLRRQLKAAVRSNPGPAAEELRRLGYEVRDPS